jgi:uncharacterized alkaline shock family protein YloU
VTVTEAPVLWAPPDRPADPGLIDPAERGRLHIAPTVLEKLGVGLIAETDGVGGAARRVLGVALGSDTEDKRARVSATVDGAIALLDVRLSIAYPAPVGATCGRVRATLVERLGALTGLEIREVDITVAALTSSDAPAARRVQ